MDDRPTDQPPPPTNATERYLNRAGLGTLRPWACPRCGCRDWRVANTYGCKTDQSIHRRRICRNCNHVRISVETMR